jgi:hypothetical protein
MIIINKLLNYIIIKFIIFTGFSEHMKVFFPGLDGGLVPVCGDLTDL